MKYLFIIFILLIASSFSFGAGYYNMMFGRSGATPFTWTGKSGDTNWSTAGNWYGGVAPGASDTAVFDSRYCGTTCNVTINVSINVRGINIRSSYGGTITQSATRSITIGSKGWTQAGGTFIGSNSGDMIAVTNDFVFSGGSFTSTSGLFKVSNHFTVANSPVFNHNSGTFVIDYNFGAGAKTITPGSLVFNHVEIVGGAYAYVGLSGILNVDGNLTTSNSDGRSSITGGTIKVKGNVTFNNYGYAGDTLIDLIGSSNQTISGTPATPHLPGIRIASTGGTVTFADTMRITGNFTYVSGTVIVDSPVLKFIGASTITPGPLVFKDVEFNNGAYNYMTLTGTMKVDGNLTFAFSDNRASIADGTIEVKGNVTSSTVSYVGSIRVKLLASTNQTISTTTSSAVLPTLEIASTGGTVSFLSSFKIIGDFIHTSGAVDTGTSRVVFISNSVSAGPVNFYDVVFENGAYVYTGITGSLNVLRDLEFASIDNRSSVSGGTIYIGRNVTFTSTYNNVSSPWVLNGSSTQVLTTTTGNFTQGNITVNNASSVVTLASNLSMPFGGQALTLNAGTLTMSGFNLDTRSLSLNGNTLTKAGGVLTVNGTVVADGAGLYGGTVAP